MQPAPRPRYLSTAGNQIVFSVARELAKRELTFARRRHQSATVAGATRLVRERLEREIDAPMRAAADQVDATIVAMGKRPSEFDSIARQFAINALHDGRTAFLSTVGASHNAFASSIASAVNDGKTLSQALASVEHPHAADPRWIEASILNLLIPLNEDAAEALEDARSAVQPMQFAAE